VKLSWLFGHSMEARHLLYAYLSVWAIQGGYFVRLALEWKRSSKDASQPLSSTDADQDL